jgi:hypothetical protein
MALDIGVGGKTLYLDDDEPGLALEDDGYYWFLYPLFVELQKATGELIDLYDGATFQGGQLAALGRTLSAARSLVASQPAAWQVNVSVPESPVYKTVNRDQFMALLDRFDHIVARAKALGRPVVCLGD